MSTLSRTQYHQIKSAYRGNLASNVDAVSVADLHALVKMYDKNFTPKPANLLFYVLKKFARRYLLTLAKELNKALKDAGEMSEHKKTPHRAV